MTIKAIETRYAGCRFRSRLEARWAVFFDTLGITWEYEPQGYELGGVGDWPARRYLPDFLIKLANGKTLVLEIKGEDSEQNKAKRSALDAWVKAVNSKGGFGVWCWDVAFDMAKIQDILDHHSC